MFHEYPKSLYMNGDIYADHIIVHSHGEEAVKRSEGYRGAWEVQEKAEPVKRGPGRPRKEQA